ncbi:hypothetical protein ACI68E_002305 [Malassezia pachydermatis]
MWWPWKQKEPAAPQASAVVSISTPTASVETPAQTLPSQAPPPYESDIPDFDDKPEPIVMPFSTLLVTSAFGMGFFSGFLQGARHTALVFLAENAHRRPETVQGWYFYNKTKYYRMLLGGFQRGAGTGLRLAGWVGGWCLLDVLTESGRKYWAEQRNRPIMPSHEALDAYRLGHWFDGSVAGFATGLIGAVSCTYETPLLTTDRVSAPTVPRMVLLGTVAGATTGALRDVRHHLMHGHEAIQ